MSGIDWTKALERIVPSPDGEPPTHLRTATVNAVNSDGTLDIVLSGVVIPNIPVVAGVEVLTGQDVNVLARRGGLLVLGPTANAATNAAGRIAWNRSTTTVNVTSTSTVGSGFGVAFTAPPSGMVMVWWRDRLNFDKTGGMLRRLISRIEVRTGSIVGSGTSVYVSNDDDAVEIGASISGTFGMRGNGSSMVRISGLTPGDTYNVEIAHRLNATADTTATSESRSILVMGVR